MVRKGGKLDRILCIGAQVSVLLMESVGSGLSWIENWAVLISTLGMRGITWVVACFAVPGCSWLL